jgi:integrase
MKFTDRSIAALKTKPERYEVWEDGRTGLGVRVSPKGRKSWVFMYRFGGKARRMGLGTYPAVGLASAHVMHAQAKELLNRGVDPGAQQIERKRAERDAETVNDLAEEYLEKWARPRKRSAGEDERIIRKDVLPAWGKKKARDIRRRDVILLLDTIMERGAPIAANRTLGVIRRLFNFGVSRDLLDATPVAMVKAPAKETPRERVLSPEELRIFWNDLEKGPISSGICLALKLQLVTAQRKGEIIGAAQSEFDLDEEMVWTIPPERAKNGKTHRVPLSPLAVSLIKNAQALADESEWLFPSPRGFVPVAGQAVNQALNRALMPPTKRPKAAKLARKPAVRLSGVTPHDLRRTAASQMAGLGISRLIISKILNHIETNVTAIYDQYGYDNEKRHALDTWAAHLESVVSGKPAASNVVSLATAGDAQ